MFRRPKMAPFGPLAFAACVRPNCCTRPRRTKAACLSMSRASNKCRRRNNICSTTMSISTARRREATKPKSQLPATIRMPHPLPAKPGMTCPWGRPARRCPTLPTLDSFLSPHRPWWRMPGRRQRPQRQQHPRARLLGNNNNNNKPRICQLTLRLEQPPTLMSTSTTTTLVKMSWSMTRITIPFSAVALQQRH